MKKTTLSRLAVILFTAAIAAVNIPVIAQPQNNRFDNLVKEYSYEVCRQYHNMNHISLSPDFNQVGSAYYKIKYNIFPICKVFPKYFEPKQSDYILPRLFIFSYEYGAPHKAKIINVAVDEPTRLKYLRADSLLRKTYAFLLSHDGYANVVDLIKRQPNDSLYKSLSIAEWEIRNASQNFWAEPMNQMYDPKKRFSFLRRVRHVSIDETFPNFSRPLSFRRDRMLPIGYAMEWQSSYYYDPYVAALQQANLASLRVILDDHIRRGVPIDISWIPEQTLAEIEATKPVRQLKKQIKALEKQY